GWALSEEAIQSPNHELFAELYARLGLVPQALFCAACGLQEGKVYCVTSASTASYTPMHLCSLGD
ncbi:sucrose operon repressor domain protein, partial [Candidatus Erwinia dacicola]